MAGSLTISTLKNDTGVFATQNAMSGIAGAWVNCGYVAAAMVTRGSFNVSSVTRNSTGNYTVNFTTAFSDANFAAVSSCNYTANNSNVSANDNTTNCQFTTTSCQVIVKFGNASYEDVELLCVVVHR